MDSRLTATLQAVLTTSRFLDRGDAAVINKAARVALDSAAAAVIDSEERGDNHAVEDSQGEVAAAGTSRRWPGPNLAALSILTLLHVSQNQREGIPAVVDVLQQMVSEWVNGIVCWFTNCYVVCCRVAGRFGGEAFSTLVWASARLPSLQERKVSHEVVRTAVSSFPDSLMNV